MVGIVTVRGELGDAEQREGAEAENLEGEREWPSKPWRVTMPLSCQTRGSDREDADEESPR